MITVITEDDRTFSIDVDASIELENLKALLEADSTIPTDQQHLLHSGKPLHDDKATLSSLGVANDDLLILRDRRQSPSSSSTTTTTTTARTTAPAASSEEQAAEEVRNRILSDPAALSMLRSNNPTLADSLQSPARFLSLLRAQQSQMEQANLNPGLQDITDEFDIDAQRRIEENIRQQRVLENLEHAIEYSPESFGRVTMLYVDVKVNGTPVKAFVDSGAQATIMSPECAEKCGIMRLLDTRFSGIARGVGTAKILGRVHSTQLQLGKGLFLPCSFTIMEGKGVDMLFGLDMLKRYQASIDLAKGVLRVNEEEIRFLDEHELPEEARIEYEVDEQGKPKSKQKEGVLGAASANANAAASAIASASKVGKFPGSGQSLSSSNTGASSSGSAGGSADQQHFDSHGWSFSHPQSSQQPQPVAQAVANGAQGDGAKQFPEASLKALTDLGATQAQARSLLTATQGNVEVAASLLFQQ
ncbi:related to DNA-damage inducible protein 2 [Ustilago sp. UG-2017a]|nr:related to DNA-damage inducible protein 2 [Ustilago sp. UG-2017a]